MGSKATNETRRQKRVGSRGQAMPLTDFQATLARLLSANRTTDSYLAGGAALHLEPNTKRYSNDLDFFCDSESRVLEAFKQDSASLKYNGYSVTIELSLPGYVRGIVAKEQNQTKVEWANDSAWRFLPTIYDERVGYMLHPVDLAINKLLALVGRDEARDFIDVLYAHKAIVSLGALCWAAAGKDPGFTPHNLLELLKRRGKYHQDDFDRLHLAEPIDLTAMKSDWLDALDRAVEFCDSRPAEEVGCLYYSIREKKFVTPTGKKDSQIVPHYGKPGGVLPSV